MALKNEVKLILTSEAEGTRIHNTELPASLPCQELRG